METGLYMESSAGREFPPIDNGLQAKLLLIGGFLPQEKRIMSGIYYGTGVFSSCGNWLMGGIYIFLNWGFLPMWEPVYGWNLLLNWGFRPYRKGSRGNYYSKQGVSLALKPVYGWNLLLNWGFRPYRKGCGGRLRFRTERS